MNINVAVIIMFGLTLLGACSVFAASSYASINALGRNPSSAPKILTAMIVSLSFAFGISFTALLFAFLHFGSR